MVGMDSMFDAAARDFTALAPLLWDRVGLAVVKASPPGSGEHVLDACCGIGSATLPIAEFIGSAGRVDAVDETASRSRDTPPKSSRMPPTSPHGRVAPTTRCSASSVYPSYPILLPGRII